MYVTNDVQKRCLGRQLNGFCDTHSHWLHSSLRFKCRST